MSDFCMNDESEKEIGWSGCWFLISLYINGWNDAHITYNLDLPGTSWRRSERDRKPNERWVERWESRGGKRHTENVELCTSNFTWPLNVLEKMALVVQYKYCICMCCVGVVGFVCPLLAFAAVRCSCSYCCELIIAGCYYICAKLISQNTRRYFFFFLFMIGLSRSFLSMPCRACNERRKENEIEWVFLFCAYFLRKSTSPWLHWLFCIEFFINRLHLSPTHCFLLPPFAHWPPISKKICTHWMR